MKQPDIKLIASDMDGTLLSPQGDLNPCFFDVFEALKQKKVIFCAASGRQYFSLKKVFEPIKDEIVFIAENGAYVVYQDTTLLVIYIDTDIVNEIIDAVREIDGAYPIVCGKKSAYIENDLPEFEKEVQRYYERYKIVNDLKQVKGDKFLKVAIYDSKVSALNSFPKLKHLEDRLKVVVSGNNWMDVSCKEANKGRAVSLIQQKFGISKEQTMSFGDQMNDLEMLQQSHYSYAVENAVDGIKSKANFIAPSNADNGVIKTIEKYFEKL